jgi:hypothetical protein
MKKTKTGKVRAARMNKSSNLKLGHYQPHRFCA